MAIFNNIDITHQSLRTQAGNLQKMKELRGEIEDSQKEESSNKPPINLTLESAIKYYEHKSAIDKTANEVNALLYKATSLWLQELWELRARKKDYNATNPKE